MSMSPRKQLACGGDYAKGGVVRVGSSSRITGVMPGIKGQPMNPLEKAKRNNGIPGYKDGGKVKKCGCK